MRQHARRQEPVGRASDLLLTMLQGKAHRGLEPLRRPVVGWGHNGAMDERELSVLRDPVRMASLRAGIEEAKAGRVYRHEPGHFAKMEAELGYDEEG